MNIRPLTNDHDGKFCAYGKLAPDSGVDAAVRDEAFFLCEVEECAVCYAGLFGYWATVATGWGPGVLCTVR